MPAKKAVKNVESATDGASEGTAGGITMSASDLEFIQQCCMNTIGGEITVDCTAVASARGQANARSIANRITTIKKKYGLPFAAGNTSGDVSKAKANDDDEAVSSPGKTPAKKATSKLAAAGTKRRATATPRKASSKKVKAEEVPLPEGDADSEEDGDEVEEGSQKKGFQMTLVLAAVDAPKKAAPVEETSEDMLYDKYDEFSNEN